MTGPVATITVMTADGGCGLAALDPAERSLDSRGLTAPNGVCIPGPVGAAVISPDQDVPASDAHRCDRGPPVAQPELPSALEARRLAVGPPIVVHDLARVFYQSVTRNYAKQSLWR